MAWHGDKGDLFGCMIRAIDRTFSFLKGLRAQDHVGFGVTRTRDEMDSGSDDAEAMLDDGKLSPSDIAPIRSIWWLIGRKIISKNTSYVCRCPDD